MLPIRAYYKLKKEENELPEKVRNDLLATVAKDASASYLWANHKDERFEAGEKVLRKDVLLWRLYKHRFLQEDNNGETEKTKTEKTIHL